MGFALQNSNVSRIFQTLGANIDDIPILWVAAHDWLNYPTYNWLFFRQDLDKIRTKKTLLLAGAILASALFIMPSPIWFAAGMLWMLPSVSMEPFRAFVGDNLPKTTYHGICHAKFFFGIGAYFASKLPLILLI
jgi:maltose/moltooligosaccharide transporter